MEHRHRPIILMVYRDKTGLFHLSCENEKELKTQMEHQLNIPGTSVQIYDKRGETEYRELLGPEMGIFAD